MTWIIIAWALFVLIFLRWNYSIGRMNKYYDEIMRREAEARNGK